jgi:UDP-N-acetyl-D-glucosamine dehydrogenase
MGFKLLEQKIKTKTIKLGVIGLGYVGLPLACEFAKEGIEVLGFDVDQEKIGLINEGKSYIIDVLEKEVAELVAKDLLSATADFSRLKGADVISICVPTPLGKTKDPDMTYIEKALESIKPNLRKGQVIILESTTYPGTTEEVILPIMEETGLKVGQDIFLAFSPERVDPGNKTYQTKNTPKVLGGVTEACTEIAAQVYELAIDNVVRVSSPSCAEMVKLLENTFRSVNIGMANEMALMCDKLGVNVWEVIEAAATKPFGFMPFFPGPGLGGHCIPIDPLYLSWKLKTLNYDARFIGLASEVNENMPSYVVEKTMLFLNEEKKCLNNAKVLVVGVAYKPDINDMRESPALEVIAKLQGLGAVIQYHDDYIPKIEIDGVDYSSKALDEKILGAADIVIVLTNHRYLDLDVIVNNSKLVFDTRNSLKGFKSQNIKRL